MKAQLVSDLHLEFRPISITNRGADLLILSGDICVAKYLKTAGEKGERFREFFHYVSQEFDQILYVMGNHEHYHGHFESTANILREHLPSNIRLLDNEYIDLGGTRFFGGTLWTQVDSPLTAMQIEGGLNDFKLIRWGDQFRRLTVPFTCVQHQKFLKTLDEAYTDNMVVIGHHAPSWNSVTEEYRTNRYAYLNSAYVTDLESFIEERPGIRLWTHGHVHSNHDYYIGTTRVVANPRGYGSENAAFDPSIILEI